MRRSSSPKNRRALRALLALRASRFFGCRRSLNERNIAGLWPACAFGATPLRGTRFAQRVFTRPSAWMWLRRLRLRRDETLPGLRPESGFTGHAPSAHPAGLQVPRPFGPPSLRSGSSSKIVGNHRFPARFARTSLT